MSLPFWASCLDPLHPPNSHLQSDWLVSLVTRPACFPNGTFRGSWVSRDCSCESSGGGIVWPKRLYPRHGQPVGPDLELSCWVSVRTRNSSRSARGKETKCPGSHPLGLVSTSKSVNLAVPGDPAWRYSRGLWSGCPYPITHHEPRSVSVHTTATPKHPETGPCEPPAVKREH